MVMLAMASSYQMQLMIALRPFPVRHFPFRLKLNYPVQKDNS
jgi:hypothetical protein